jgi:dephospho-CoA kinase
MVHPPLLDLLRKRIEEALREAPSRPVVVDAALIVECGLQDWFDVLITVVAPEAEQIRRLVEYKGLDPGEAADRIHSQLPTDRKAAVADYVIQNDGTLKTLVQRTLAVWKMLRSHQEDG